MTNFEQSRRARVGGGNGKWVGIVVLLGAALLGLMITLGNLDAPPQPTPTPQLVAPARSPTPTIPVTITPTPRPAVAGLMYLLMQGSSFNGATNRYVRVLDTATNATLYTFADVLDLALSADGRTVYTLYANAVVATDAGTLRERWRAGLRPMNDRVEANALALSADGGTLWVLRQTVDAVGIRQTRLERISTDAGQSNGLSIELEQGFWRPTLYAGGADSVIIADGDVLLHVNLLSGETQNLSAQTSGPFVVALAAGQNSLYVANSDSILTAMSRFDPFGERRSVQYALSLLPTFGFDTMAVAPNGELVALALRQREPPNSQVLPDTAEFVLALFDPKTGKIVQQTAWPAESRISSLAYSSDGTTVFFTANNSIFAWDLASNGINKHVLTMNDFVERVLVGPAVPFDAPPPTAVPPAPTPTTIPTIPPLLQPDAAPLAWLWPITNADNRQNVAVYNADGSARIIAERVLATIPRPHTTPLLLRETAAGAWQVLDPTAGTTVTLQTDQTLSTLVNNENLVSQFLLSPDGNALAFLSDRDPIATDAITSARQLVIADLRSGATRSLLTGITWQQLYDTALTEWADDGLYLFDDVEWRFVDGLYESVWRIDPNAAQPTPELVYRLPEQGGFVQLNAQAGVVLGQTESTNEELSPLAIHNLHTNTTTTLSANVFRLNPSQQLLSPDGAYLVYGRRSSANRNQLELVLYKLADQTEYILARKLSLWGGRTIAWSGAHTLHLANYDQRSRLSVSNEQVWTIDPVGEPQLTERFAPNTIQSPGQLTSDLLLRRTSIDLIYSEGYAVLRRIQLDPTPTLDVVLPFPLLLSPNSPFNDRMKIVYLP